MFRKILGFSALAMLLPAALSAQAPVSAGCGSYAPTLPTYKAWTSDHGGVNATYSMTRKYYVDETDRDGNPRPIPTNDWWTDVINNRFSECGGALWSYPAMVRANSDGFQISYPTYWQADGGEMRAATWVKVGGEEFQPVESRATDWHDWDVEVTLPDRSGSRRLTATLVHGQPFTWVESDGVTLSLTFSARPEIVRRDASGVLLALRGRENHNTNPSAERTDYYAIYCPDGVAAEIDEEGTMRLPGAAWVSVGLLPDAASFERYAAYGASVVRDTRVSWSYSEATGELKTTWDVTAENLRDAGAPAPVMQGFLPHAYKHALNPTALINTADTYLTPRGLMKMAASDAGSFGYSYRFYGMLPYYARPSSGNLAAGNPADFDEETVRQLIKGYAERGTFGADTYWGGKGLTQMALNMTFAREMGYDDLYELSKKKLRERLEDWFTYTPGEPDSFFAYYPRLGGMLGFEVSYDSDSFNDHHFHYGYFLYAAALLCLEDREFAEGYGELLTMIAKDYANYDRNDKRFPFLRTLDPWAGHSYAGGMGDHGNDNGNGQESSSEAMQGWGGVYLLGVALRDNELRDVGIFGWMTESRGTLEYWFDRDHLKYDSASGYDPTKANYDYTKYKHPWNTNITSKGIGWWTWFSGDAVWMHSIQWMPVSPCLNYLSEDIDFARWDYDTMKANSQSDWWMKNQTGTDANGNPTYADVWGDASLGNVVLSYMQRGYPAEAAEIFQTAWSGTNPYNNDGTWGMAHGIDTGHISYFVIHNHLTYGEIDYSVTASVPTANCFVKDGHKTYHVYNPGDTEMTVSFSDGRIVKAAPRRLTVFDAPAVASELVISVPDGGYIEPGKSGRLTVSCLDQYGVSTAMPGAVTWTAGSGAGINRDGLVSVNSSTKRGSEITIIVTAGQLSATQTIVADRKPYAVSSRITGVPVLAETGSDITMGFETTDQYGRIATPGGRWTFSDDEGNTETSASGRRTFDRAGLWHITATAADGATATATLRVLPKLPNVALHKEATASSYENAGSLPSGATDGDYGVRWGSEHSDDQWLMVDLGDRYSLTAAAILWEAAYAADYDIEISDDGRDWSTAAEVRGNSGAGWADTPLGVTCRFVRIKCLRRGSVYGYSFYELELRGVPANAGDDTVVGIDMKAEPAYIRDNETSQMSATAITLGGARRQLDASSLVWGSDKPARFTGATFVPATYGIHAVSVTTADKAYRSEAKVLVEETEKLHSLSAVAASAEIVEGGSTVIDVTAYNQFKHNNEYNNDRGLYPIDLSKLGVTVSDASGSAVTDRATAWYDAESGIFHGLKPGVYTVTFSYEGKTADCRITVTPFSDYNLALNKPARATSALQDALFAVDGKLDTRWETEHGEGEHSITVDLCDSYELTSIKLFWEGAYATDYEVQVADEASASRSGFKAPAELNWVTVDTKTGWNGQPSLNQEISLSEQAHYIRVVCKKRALDYGYSLYEIQAFGRQQVSLIDTVGDSDDDTVDVYNLQGVRVASAVSRAGLRDLLVPGIYILRGARHSSKIIIR